MIEQPFHSYILYVSIHAPARGATFRGIRRKLSNKSFNPRSREGSDNANQSNAASARMFQSTLPRGERPTDSLIPDFLGVFQSTLPRGERQVRILRSPD